MKKYALVLLSILFGDMERLDVRHASYYNIKENI